MAPGDRGSDGADLPVLAVVHGAPTFGVFDLAEAASGTCRLAFVLDGGDRSLARLLGRLGPLVDIGGMPDAEALARTRSLGAEGITTFSDRHLRRTASLADGLGVPYHAPEVAEVLARKYEQRRALERAGLPGPRVVRVEPDDPELGSVASDVCFPVVVKPDAGTGSRETTMASGRDELLRAIARASSVGIASLVIEEYLPDDPEVMAPDFASFVSVESVLGGGAIRHLAVTGKFPLAPPFRETGHFIPSQLPPARLAEVLDAATRAIAALGLTVGVVHTEVKLTPSGPRIIEVNGRTAGAVPGVLAAASGFSLIRCAMEAALGAATDDGLVPCEEVGYRVNIQPPTWASRVLAVAGTDSLPGPPAVQQVNILRSGGDAVDWREGTDGLVAAITGSVDSLAQLEEVRREIASAVTVTYG